MYCPKCRKPLFDENKCIYCDWIKTEEIQPAGIYCYKCGNLIPQDSVFCAACGAPQNQQIQYKQPQEKSQQIQYKQEKKKKELSPIVSFGIIFFAAIFFLPLIFGNLAKNKRSPSTSNSPQSEEIQYPTTPEIEKRATEATTEAKPKTNVTMTGHYLTQNSLGENILVVEYDYYNGEDKPQSFTWTASDKCYQNGIACSDWVLTLDEVDTHKQTAEVQPGITNHFAIGYKLDDLSDVNIVVKELIGDKEFVNETFSPQS